MHFEYILGWTVLLILFLVFQDTDDDDDRDGGMMIPSYQRN